MLLISSDIASLDVLLSWWENAEYIAESFVILGCLGEFIAEFTKVSTLECRTLLSKVSLLVLIAALAFELGALVRTNYLSGQEIAMLNSIAAEARTRAADAESTAKGFDSKIAEAQRGTAEAQRDSETAKERASKADERAAVNEKEAARLGKLAEDERLARVMIEEKLAPRRLTVEQIRAIATKLRKFSGQRLNFFATSGDSEVIGISGDIFKALTGPNSAEWIVTPLTGQDSSVIEDGIVIEVSPDADAISTATAQTLADALRTERLLVIGPQKRRGGSVMGQIISDPNAKIRLVVSKKP